MVPILAEHCVFMSDPIGPTMRMIEKISFQGLNVVIKFKIDTEAHIKRGQMNYPDPKFL